MALAIVKVGRNGNNCLGYFFAQFRFGIRLEFGKNEGGNFFRGIDFLFALHLDFDTGRSAFAFDHFIRQALDFLLNLGELTPDQALHGVNRVF